MHDDALLVLGSPALLVVSIQYNRVHRLLLYSEGYSSLAAAGSGLQCIKCVASVGVKNLFIEDHMVRNKYETG